MSGRPTRTARVSRMRIDRALAARCSKLPCRSGAVRMPSRPDTERGRMPSTLKLASSVHSTSLIQVSASTAPIAMKELRSQRTRSRTSSEGVGSASCGKSIDGLWGLVAESQVNAPGLQMT